MSTLLQKKLNEVKQDGLVFIHWLILHIMFPILAAIALANEINGHQTVDTWGDAEVRLLCGLVCVLIANAPMLTEMCGRKRSE